MELHSDTRAIRISGPRTLTVLLDPNALSAVSTRSPTSGTISGRRRQHSPSSEHASPASASVSPPASAYSPAASPAFASLSPSPPPSLSPSPSFSPSPSPGLYSGHDNCADHAQKISIRRSDAKTIDVQHCGAPVCQVRTSMALRC